MSKLRNNVLSLLERFGNERAFRCEKYESKTQKTQNVVELSGSMNCLLYFKTRSGKPYTWGVTRAVIQELRNSGTKWFLALFFETPANVYLLTQPDIENYVQHRLWHLGKNEKNRGDYKPSPGKALQFNQPFGTFEDFVRTLFDLSGRDASALSQGIEKGYEEYPPNRIRTTITRTVRDTALTGRIKRERKHRCQVCSMRLTTKGKPYAEAHPVKPVGHGGPDSESNILVLCPNHHVLFDRGEITILPEDIETIIDSKGNRIGTTRPPLPKRQFLQYHHRYIYKA